MKNLLKKLGFNSDMQYFEYIVESFLNGQKKQAIDLFCAMSRDYKVKFITSALTHWSSGLSNSNISTLVEFMYFSK